ncbi:MAG: glycosyltransferase family 4 protein [Thermoplasmata archaeon]
MSGTSITDWMNILMFLSNPFVHDPRVYHEAQTLKRYGHSVTVVAWDRSGEHPSREVLDGVMVVRIRNTGLMRLVPYDIFRMRFWWRRARLVALELSKNETFDVVHCHDLDTLPIGVWLKDRLPVKLVYDAHEVFTYMLRGEVPSFLIRRFERMEGRMMRRADRMITVGEKYKEYFISKGISDIALVMNAKNIEVDGYVRPSNVQPVVTYIGSLKSTRFVKELAHAGSEVEGIRVVIAGKGPDETEVKEIASRYENVTFLGMVPMKDVIPLTLESDVVFTMFDPRHPLAKIGFPNKFFEALATGRPILASEGTYVGEIVKELDCGVVVTPDKSGIVKGLRYVVDHPEELERMGRNALEAAKRTYNWPAQGEALLDVYRSLEN